MIFIYIVDEEPPFIISLEATDDFMDTDVLFIYTMSIGRVTSETIIVFVEDRYYYFSHPSGYLAAMAHLF